MFFKRKSVYDNVIVGLGNPGPKYAETRHNVGFKCLDLLAEGTEHRRAKFHSRLADAEIAGRRCLLCWPQTYMNNSGEAVSEILRFYKLPVQSLIVILDDINLAPGRLRIRRDGSHGGHNGMKDIIEMCGSDDIKRIKIGVGGSDCHDEALVNWVLSPFSKSDLDKLNTALSDAAKAVGVILSDGVDVAMNLFNR